MGVDILHQGVVEDNIDIQIRDARIARHRDDRADQTRSRPDGLRHIGAGVGGAVYAFVGGRMHADAERISRRGPADGGGGGIDKGEIGTRRLDCHEQGFGGNIRIRRHIACAGIVDNKNLVVRITEQGHTQAPIPDHGVTLRIRIERQVNGVSGVEVEAVPVLLGRRGGVARATDPAIGRQWICGGRRVVGFHFRRGGTTLQAEMQLVWPFRCRACREIVDPDVVGAGSRDDRACNGR